MYYPHQAVTAFHTFFDKQHFYENARLKLVKINQKLSDTVKLNF